MFKLDFILQIEGGHSEATMHLTASDTQVLLQPVIGERTKRVGYLNTIFAAALYFILTVSESST